ncbi:MAG: hypothetical protein D6770_03445 [Anaerolineae bacterium]|nr:MAG: hypothetical protein D6770_03445 [Anaerolineae bacterium]
MRRLIPTLFLLLTLTACARLKRRASPPAPTVPSPQAAAERTPTPAIVASTETPSQPPASTAPVPTPDFASMTFAEKNELFLQLLAERQAAGMDTSAAEEAYTRSMEASFSGDASQADRYLEEAILLLWNP